MDGDTQGEREEKEQTERMRKRRRKEVEEETGETRRGEGRRRRREEVGGGGKVVEVEGGRRTSKQSFFISLTDLSVVSIAGWILIYVWRMGASGSRLCRCNHQVRLYQVRLREGSLACSGASSGADSRWRRAQLAHPPPWPSGRPPS